MAFDKSKFIPRFVEEAREHLRALSSGLVSLEKAPDDAETLNGIFRSAHTIKGSARMMKLIPISELAHKLEDTLDGLRSNRVVPEQGLSDLLFRTIDAIEAMLDAVDAGRPLDDPPADLVAALEQAAAGEPVPPSAPATETETETAAEPAAPAADAPPDTPSAPDPAAPAILEAEPAESPAPSAPPAPEAVPSSSPGPPADGVIRPTGTVRINADKLDELIKLMGEIVSGHTRAEQRLVEIRELEKLARRQAALLPDSPDRVTERGWEEIRASARALHEAAQSFLTAYKEDVNVSGLLTSDLQERAIRMRMMPLATIFDPLGRTVRNLARGLDKAVDLVIEGAETELDKKIIEKIGDPLLHMIRNSIDHGIEPSAERRAAGKPERGTLRIRAGYEGGNVLIELSDDGAGIPVAALKEKADRKGLPAATDLSTVTESELVNLIFVPGLSTSELITDISGRGVGMDVVKRNIEDLKGSIQVRTHAGAGTTIQLRLPLTMAVIHVLFITVSGMTFTVPANFIEEIIRADASSLIRVVGRKAVKVREEIIPVVRLHDVLNLPAPEPNGSGAEDTPLLILITSMGSEKLGLVVDALINEADVVIKPLPPHMADVQMVSGAIVSGTNEIFNVLHPPKIIEAARDLRRGAPVPTAGEPEAPARKLQILVVDDSVSTREIEKSILESYGYAVDLAGDGMEGLERARGGHYDLVITDVEMPRLDGFSLTETLRSETEYAQTPIILVTSLDRESDKRRGIQVGADAYIVKGGFDQSTLMDAVRNLVGRSEP